MTSPAHSSYGSSRVWLLTMLGFSSGLPLALVGHTLTAWMTDAGVDLKTVGFFTAVMLPYSIKFLWAPLVDIVRLPFLDRRRSWALVFQVLLVIAIVTMASIGPSKSRVALAACALTIAFLAASQDIVLDAYRTDILAPDERAAGTATFVTGYRIGMLASGSLALVLADIFPWPVVYGSMAGLISIGIIAILLAPSPPAVTPIRSLEEAVTAPFRNFFSRSGAILALVFLMLYKLGDAFAGALTTRFFKETGFTNTELGTFHSGVGLFATIAGAFLAGWLQPLLGERKSLLIFGSLQALTNVFFVILAITGKSVPLLISAVIFDNIAAGLGSAALMVFQMSLCEARFSATQFALFSAISSVGARVLGGFSGVMAQSLGWPLFFGVTILIAVPGILLILVLPRSLAEPGNGESAR
ncbi:MAG: MFS transporter [Thermoanaerobaculia bacterium]|nr:MFS transporter [Thermoanaerobaculia bacterium]